MQRYRLGSVWDRNNRNGVNKNFEYLFEGRQKTDELNIRADIILNEAKQTNDMNEDVQQQITDLILSEGESDAEVINARGGLPLLKDRLDLIDERIDGLNIYAAHFGAVGDGVNNDRKAIQDAVDYAVSLGGGNVILPKGIAKIDEEIVLSDGVKLSGHGMFASIIKPEWMGQNVLQNVVTTDGTPERMNKNIEVSDFGVDCSNVEFWENGDITHESGRFGRIEARHVENFVAKNIYNYHGSHVFEIRACKNFIITNVITDYCFNTIHMLGSVGYQGQGIIDNIIATRCTTVIDFGAGGGDIIINNIYADAEGYVMNNQEAIDLGGAQNVKISNSTFKNFYRGMQLKEESGAVWDNIELNNVDFIDCKMETFNAVLPQAYSNKKLTINNCNVVSHQMIDESKPFMNLQSPGIHFNVNNLNVDVNGAGLNVTRFKKMTGDKININSVGGGLISSPQDYRAETVNLENFNVRSISGSFEFRSIDDLRLSNFDFKCDVGALDLRLIKKPTLLNGKLDLGNEAIRVFYGALSIEEVGNYIYLPLTIKNVEFYNWGTNVNNRNGIYFSKLSDLDNNTNPVVGINIKNLKMVISEGKENQQIGMSWYGFSDNTLEHSIVDELYMINVYSPQIGAAQGKGDSVKGEITEI